MSDDDLIRRGDALNAVLTTDFRHEAHDAIAALPAQGVDVDKLRRIADDIYCLDARSRVVADAILAALEPASGRVEEPISDARLECEVLCARFQAGEASEKEVVDTIRYIARANERLAVRLGEAKAAARYSVSAEWVERMLPADEGVTPAAGGSNDEAAMHIETALAMARVQDGYASKATGEGEKLIFKANAKAQRQIADYIRRMSAPAEAGGVEADQDELVQKLHKFAPAPVEALVKAADAFSDAYRTWSMIRRDGPGEALAFEQMHRFKVDLDAALAAYRGDAK